MKVYDNLRFRIWSEEEGCFVENLDIFRINHLGCLYFNNDYLQREPSVNPNKFFLCLCTGMKDIDERYIYDGDLVRNNKGEIYEVNWCQDKLGFVFRPKNLNECLESLDITSQDWEIIGNIYECEKENWV